jgi:hypothetical protein
MRKIGKKEKSLTYYKNRAWKVFSNYIRTRDCIATTGNLRRGKCVTCNKEFPFEELQAGHAIGGRNNSILFDEELVNAQCRGCNGFGNGKYAEYSLWFINRYGLEKWEEKIRLSKTAVKYTKEDYKKIYEDYRNKLNNLLL